MSIWSVSLAWTLYPITDTRTKLLFYYIAFVVDCIMLVNFLNSPTLANGWISLRLNFLGKLMPLVRRVGNCLGWEERSLEVSELLLIYWGWGLAFFSPPKFRYFSHFYNTAKLVLGVVTVGWAQSLRTGLVDVGGRCWLCLGLCSGRLFPLSLHHPARSSELRYGPMLTNLPMLTKLLAWGGFAWPLPFSNYSPDAVFCVSFAEWSHGGIVTLRIAEGIVLYFAKLKPYLCFHPFYFVRNTEQSFVFSNPC